MILIDMKWYEICYQMIWNDSKMILNDIQWFWNDIKWY